MPSCQSLSTPRGEFVLEQPSTSSSCCELRPGFIAMVRNRPFSGVISDDPNVHLEEFEDLCSCLVIPGMTQETLRWKLFPFSLVDRAEQWYTHTAEHVNNWGELRENFCDSFSLYECIELLPCELLNFEQLEGESIGAAWARFLRLMTSSPDMSIPDDIATYTFYTRIDMESAQELDLLAGGSFENQTLVERREIL